MNRRHFLHQSTLGFGSIALAGMLNADANGSPYTKRDPHHSAKAKRIIFLCMKGGPSHLDMFDYKPRLQQDHGKSFDGQTSRKYTGSPFKTRQHGQAGMWFSELLPELAKQADELCMLNGVHTDSPEHGQALDFLHTGSSQFVRPSMGSWVLYGLGAENQDLPGFITINPPSVLAGSKYYGNSFLPAAYQGTPIGGNNRPLSKVRLRDIENARLNRGQQRERLDLLQAINRKALADRGGSSELEGVIETFELGFRMQRALPEVMDISSESEATLALYGMDDHRSRDFGHQCLLARRMAEADVRFIQLTKDGWDTHSGLTTSFKHNCCFGTDKPIAGLITDLKQRNLLDDTLIVWGGEFGRAPFGNRDGRGHNSNGYTMFLAGAGVKHGFRHGATDEHGHYAVEGRVHIHDLHATMLHLLGLDHEQLTYTWSGRDFRLTDVYGNVVTELLA